MKIGIVGPVDLVNMVLSYAPKDQLGVDFYPLVALADESAKKVDDWQKSFDGLYFTSYVHYIACSNKYTPVIPWEYMQRTKYTMVMTLLAAIMKDNIDLSRISYDLPEDADAIFLRKLLTYIGRSPDDIICFNPLNETFANVTEYVRSAVNFHIKNLTSGKATLCVTGMETIRNAVTAAGFPVYWIEPLEEHIKEQLIDFSQRCKLTLLSTRSPYFPCVIAAEINAPDNNILNGNNDFLTHRTASRVIDTLYNFANLVNGAVEAHENSTSYVYFVIEEAKIQRNKLIVQLYEMLNAAELTDKIWLGSGVHLSMGLSKEYAIKALKIAKKNDFSSYCKIVGAHSEEKIIGPFSFEDISVDTNTENEAINKLSEISKASGIGMRTIQKIYNIVEQYQIKSTTVSEFASVSGLGKSNVNRIVRHLEAAGYIETVGVQPLETAGRPHRLFSFKF